MKHFIIILALSCSTAKLTAEQPWFWGLFGSTTETLPVVEDQPEPPAEIPLPVEEPASSLPTASFSQTDPSSYSPTTHTQCLQPLNAQAIPQWLNSLNIGSFFSRTNQLSRCNDDCFLSLCADDAFNAWGETYGVYSNYSNSFTEKNLNPIDFTLTTFGFGIGGGYSLSEYLNLGIGLGYFHSTIHWKECQKGETTINAIYVGPYIEYLLKQGFIGFMVYAIDNFSSIHQKKSNDISYSNWDVAMRLEAGYDFKLPSDFTLYPYLLLDYIKVLNPNQPFKPEKNHSLTIENKSSPFLCSKLAVQLSKTLFCHHASLLLSTLDLGWLNMVPLSSIDTQEKPGEDHHFKMKNKNQCALGLELSCIHNKNILLSLRYEAALGAHISTQTGRVRVEWSF